MKIGLVSDTHNYFPTEIYTYFEEVDEIWHAGDIGSVALIDEFNAFKKSKFVFGNIDGHEARAFCPEYRYEKINGIGLLMIHIAGKPPTFNSITRALLKKYRPDALICGHSHILRVLKDRTFHDLLFINPGAAGKVGFHKNRSLIRFEIQGQKITNMEAIDLGPRAKLRP